jgi:hypothetical protein
MKNKYQFVAALGEKLPVEGARESGEILLKAPR